MNATALEDVESVHAATGLPIVLALASPALERADLAARGARVLSTGHHPVFAAAKALQHAYAHLARGGSPGDLGLPMMSDAELARAVRREESAQFHREYLRTG